MVKEKVLVIDDDVEFLNTAGRWLKNAGYEAILTENSIPGLRRLFETHPDLVLLDVSLPEMDGWEICRRIRDMSEIPIIMLTTDGKTADILRGFSLGADDFVKKPLEFPELIARIGAILRRTLSSRRELADMYFHPEIEVDWRTHRVFVQGNLVKLSPTEYKLLACLIENEGCLVTHTDLLKKVWGPDYIDGRPLVKLYICYLRQKIEKNPGNPRLILTERGIGYRFAIPEKDLQRQVSCSSQPLSII